MSDRIRNLHPDERLEKQDLLKQRAANKKKNLLKAGGAVLVGALIGVAAEKAGEKAIDYVAEDNPTETSESYEESEAFPKVESRGEKFVVISQGFNKENGQMIFVANILFNGKVYPLKCPLELSEEEAYSIKIKSAQAKVTDSTYSPLQFTFVDKRGKRAVIAAMPDLSGRQKLLVVVSEVIGSGKIKDIDLEITPGRIAEIDFLPPDQFKD